MANDLCKESFLLAINSLTAGNPDEKTSGEILQGILDEFDEHLKWLREIPGEVMKKFAVKSTKFSQLPKTPSVKRKAQKRTKRQAQAIEENDENEPPEVLPKKLQFEEEADQPETEQPSRPVRRCRRTKSNQESNKPPVTRTTRQSRKPLAKRGAPEASSIPEEHASLPEKPQVTVLKGNCKAEDLEDVKVTASPVPFASGSSTNKDSPSVRDRANAYETMLRTQHVRSVSPLKTRTALTPNAASPLRMKTALTPSAASPNFAAATISSQAKASPCLSSGKTKKTKRSNSKSSASRRSFRRSSKRLSASRCSSTKKKPPAKPHRSKLRLKKQKARTDDDEEETSNETKQQQNTLYNKLADVEMSPSEEVMSDIEDTQQNDEKEEDVPDSAHNDTQVVVTEVFELYNDERGAELKEMEVVETKSVALPDKTTVGPAATKPSGTITNHRFSSDQGFDEGDHDGSSDSSESRTNLNGTFTKVHQPVVVGGPSTRTRTRKVHADVDADAVRAQTQQAAPPTVDKVDSPEVPAERSTRTRTRALKAKEDEEQEVPQETVGRSTRTRQRQTQEQSKPVDASVRDVSVVKKTAPDQNPPSTPEVAPFRSTRSKMRKIDQSVVDGHKEVVLAGSPAIKSPAVVNLKKKRLLEERGESPRPKRSRSCIEEQSHLGSIPMSTSSPVRHQDLNESKDIVNDSVYSPPSAGSRPYLFQSAQKRTNGYMNRTPGFTNNTKLLTFFGSAPLKRSNGVFTSFLKRNTPPPKPTAKNIQEQKQQRLLEKEAKDKERLKRAAEEKRKRLEQQKRCRDERLRKAAELREMREQKTQEMKELMKRKYEDKVVLQEKMVEEKLKAENEKQKLRAKKQMEADARRRHEEEERKRKRLEQEEDTRRQNELMQRKKEYEEQERKRQIAEERRRQEERLAEKEQRENEELARLQRLEEEKKRERERAKRERERIFAHEKAERDRIEREKREERSRKLKEEMEKLRAMEKMRLKKQEEEARQRQIQQVKLNEMHKLISQHNQQILASGTGTTAAGTTAAATTTTLNTTHTMPPKGTSMNTSSNGSNYQITPAVKKLYKPSANPNDYGLSDKDSDESTDDESAPKKKIPSWASWSNLDTALVKQFTMPPDLEAIFSTRSIEPLDLLEVFPRSRHRHNFNKRTSSAVWHSPPVKGRRQF